MAVANALPSARFEVRDRSPMEVTDDGLRHVLRLLLPCCGQTAWNRCDQFLDAVFTSCINLCRHHSCIAFWKTTLLEIIMGTSALAQSASNRYPQAAGPIHTIFVLVVLGGWTFYGKSLADSLNSAANPNRLRFYVLTLFFEWLLFVLVIAGVRHSGAPVRIVLGDQWYSVRQVLRDIGIAAAFWIVSSGILFVLGWLLRVAALGCVPGLPDGDSDRPVRSDVRDSGPLARKRSPGNDRSCMERFIERSACRFIEAIEPALCQ